MTREIGCQIVGSVTVCIQETGFVLRLSGQLWKKSGQLLVQIGQIKTDDKLTVSE